MPRIAAANIEEHVRNQEQRILDAARDLIASNGYRDTDMTHIAESMGLARNSLYRYYSNKDHILVAVVKREMAPFIDELIEVQRCIEDPIERVDAWIGLQLEMAAGPCEAMIQMFGEIPPQARELREEMTALHEPPIRVLRSAVEEILEGSDRDPQLVAVMISSMVRSAIGIAIQAENSDACIAELRHSVSGILRAGPWVVDMRREYE